jgi:glycosyltransferase involved in cell wall biosynthesis
MSEGKLISETAPKISVLMVTYNHEQYIAAALDSVFAQRHDYSREIVVGDDASTDLTREIVNEYSQKHSGVIRLIQHPQNVGHCRNYFSVLEACRGEYVALLDGDDYWTDPDKLKKQIEFLDEHPDFVLSCHRFRRHYIRQDRYEDDLYPELYENNPDGFVMEPERFFSHWVAQTLTVVVRRSAVDISEFQSYKYFADVHLFFSVLQKGKGYAHGFFGAMYNMHGDGVWSKLNEYQRCRMNYNIVAELRKRYPNDVVLKRAYALFRQSLLWMEYTKLKAERKSLRSGLRIPWLWVQLLLSDPGSKSQTLPA